MSQPYQPTLTAPCGCTFTGRVYSYQGCREVDPFAMTARQLMRHCQRVAKDAR